MCLWFIADFKCADQNVFGGAQLTESKVGSGYITNRLGVDLILPLEALAFTQRQARAPGLQQGVQCKVLVP